MINTLACKTDLRQATDMRKMWYSKLYIYFILHSRQLQNLYHCAFRAELRQAPDVDRGNSQYVTFILDFIAIRISQRDCACKSDLRQAPDVDTGDNQYIYINSIFYSRQYHNLTAVLSVQNCWVESNWRWWRTQRNKLSHGPGEGSKKNVGGIATFEKNSE